MEDFIFFPNMIPLFSSWPLSHPALPSHSCTIFGTFHLMHLSLKAFLFVLIYTCISRPIGNSQGPGRWGCFSPSVFHSLLTETPVSMQKPNLEGHVGPIAVAVVGKCTLHSWEYFYLPQSWAWFSVWFCPYVWMCPDIPFCIHRKVVSISPCVCLYS